MVQEIVLSSSYHQPSHNVADDDFAEWKLSLGATYVWEPATDDDDDEYVHDNDGDNFEGDDEKPAMMIKAASCMDSLCLQALSLWDDMKIMKMTKKLPNIDWVITMMMVQPEPKRNQWEHNSRPN